METLELKDSVKWLDDNTLEFTAHYDWPQPHTTVIEFSKCDPCGVEFCYWCAIGGQCFAFKPNSKETCIATVQHALMASDLPRSGGWLDANYVIWQPKNHSQATWERWQKKWSKRTTLA